MNLWYLNISLFCCCWTPFLSTVAALGSSLLCGQTFLIIKEHWSSYARSQKMYVLPLLFSLVYILLWTSLSLTRDSMCSCCRIWDIILRLILHFTEDSPHLHWQMLVRCREITHNSISAWALTCVKSKRAGKLDIWRNNEGIEFVYRKKEAQLRVRTNNYNLLIPKV